MTNVEKCAYGGQCLPHTGISLLTVVLIMSALTIVGVAMYALSKRKGW